MVLIPPSPYLMAKFFVVFTPSLGEEEIRNIDISLNVL